MIDDDMVAVAAAPAHRYNEGVVRRVFSGERTPVAGVFALHTGREMGHGVVRLMATSDMERALLADLRNRPGAEWPVAGRWRYFRFVPADDAWRAAGQAGVDRDIAFRDMAVAAFQRPGDAATSEGRLVRRSSWLRGGGVGRRRRRLPGPFPCVR